MPLCQNPQSRNRYYLLTLITALTLLSCDYLGFFEDINNHSYDLLFRLRGSQAPSQDIIIVAIDDMTLEELGRWPISRHYYSKLLEKLNLAKVVGFDIFFPDFAEYDKEFQQAIQQHGKVILATYISSQKGIVTPSFAFPANRLAHVHLDMGVDGVFRDVFHTIKTGDITVPSFSSLILQFATTGSVPDVLKTPSHSIHTLLQPLLLQQQDFTGINYYGDANIFQHIPLVEILNSDKWPASYFTDKIVLVGVTAIGQNDFVLIPFTEDGKGMSGVEVQATILNNLLDKSSISKPPERMLILFQCLATIALIFLIRMSFSQRLILLYPVMLICITGINCLLFLSFRTWIPPAYYIVFLSGNFVCAYICRLEAMKHSLNQANRDWHDSFISMQEAVIIHGFHGTILLTNKNGKIFDSDFTKNVLMERTKLLTDGHEVLNNITLSDPVLNKHLEISSFVRHDEDGVMSGVMHVLRDITEIKKMHEKENILQTQLVKAQKMESIGRLAGGVAHDFNNVLSAVIGFSEMIRIQSPEDSDINDFAKSIAKAGTRGATLARQLLVFSRKQTIKKTVIDPLILIENMIKMLQRMIAKNILISIDSNETFTGKIFADPGQIEQVLMNLVVNAGDSMPDGGNIIISTLNCEIIHEKNIVSGPLPSGSYVVITIMDTGMGIPSEQLEYIFEPFFSTKSEERGTGLGLSTVYGIVHQHQGFIDVQSTVGFGTNFSIYFPRCTKEMEQQEEESAGILEKGTESILIIEEEQFFRKVMSEILIHLGYTVISVENDTEAISYCKSPDHHIDLLITGLIKPGMSGKYLAEKLKKNHKELRILYISDYQEDIMTKFGEWSEGYEYFLQKPVTPSNLSLKIRKIFSIGNSASDRK